MEATGPETCGSRKTQRTGNKMNEFTAKQVEEIKSEFWNLSDAREPRYEAILNKLEKGAPLVAEDYQFIAQIAEFILDTVEYGGPQSAGMWKRILRVCVSS